VWKKRERKTEGGENYLTLILAAITVKEQETISHEYRRTNKPRGKRKKPGNRGKRQKLGNKIDVTHQLFMPT